MRVTSLLFTRKGFRYFWFATMMRGDVLFCHIKHFFWVTPLKTVSTFNGKCSWEEPDSNVKLHKWTMCLMHCPVEIWNQIHQNKFLYERLGRQQQQQKKNYLLTHHLCTSSEWSKMWSIRAVWHLVDWLRNNYFFQFSPLRNKLLSVFYFYLCSCTQCKFI